jgi:hypothetical protein
MHEQFIIELINHSFKNDIVFKGFAFIFCTAGVTLIVIIFTFINYVVTDEKLKML